jgi:hypothetical protein
MHATDTRTLTELIQELLDAHQDTIRLGSAPGVENAQPLEQLRWHAHLDYLRALGRQGHQTLARLTPQQP